MDKDLRANWEMVKLGDVCHKITDGSHNPPKGVEYSEYLMLSSKNVFDDKITGLDPRYLSKEEFYSENKRTDVSIGDILLTIVGTIGRSAVVNDDLKKFTLQRSVAVLKPKLDIIDSRFGMYSLISKRTLLTSESRGIAQKGIYLKQIKEIQIPLPRLEEQKRIAKNLDLASELVKLRKTELKELDKLIQSVFYDMFGDPVNNEKGWEVNKLAKVTFKIGSGSTPKGGKESYISEGISLIRSMNVYDGKFKYKGLAHLTDEQAEKLKNVAVEYNDILLNITGASVARTCIVPNNILPARVNQHVSIIRCDNNIIAPIYVNRLLASLSFKQKLLDLGSDGGATREAITKHQLEVLEIPIPPQPLQQKFADIVTQIEEQKVQVQTALDDAQMIYNSLMQEYFE